MFSSEELSDGIEEASFRPVEIDSAVLTDPVVLGALGGLVVGMSLLVWPDRSDLVFSRLVAIGLLWLALVGIRAFIAPAENERRWSALAGPVLTLAVAVVLLLNPERSSIFVGRLIGAVLLAYAIRSAYRLVRSAEPDLSRLPFMTAVAALGVLLVTLTDALLATVITVSALLLVSVCLLTLVVSLDARTQGAANYRDTSGMVLNWLRDRPKSVDARQALYDKILYEGPTTRTRVIRFFTLMGFASVIASTGVIADSTAVVIGAMLVAPLMTPLMGMAISLVMGWPNRLARAAMIALGGIVFAIAIGVLLGLTSPLNIDTAVNPQILARTSPTIIDLITAVAAGGAGAYGLSRPDVSDSLPGVAIAISLVPPLTVVGIAFSQGDWSAGLGALLLFTTNMLAILIVGGSTFVLTGVTPIDHAASSRDRVRTAVGATLTAAVIVFGALLANGLEITTAALQQSTIEEQLEAWLPDDGPHRLVEARVNGDVVNAVVIGPSDGLPPVQDLADGLGGELGREMTVNVSLVVEERLTAIAGG